MSRITVHQDKRFHLVKGDDHALGNFLQLFDREMEDQTPEGEGLVIDWSEFFGMEINLTGIVGDDPWKIAMNYLKDNNVELIT
jgi:hypothetical protein